MGKGIVTLDYVIKNVLVALEEQSMNKYQYFLQLAVRGFRELNLHNSTVSKTTYLPISANKTVDLPLDFIKYIKVGVVVNGRIVLLGVDDSLALNHAYDNCGNPLELAIAELNSEIGEQADLLSWGYYFLDYFHSGQFIGGLYGIGGGYNGYGYFRLNPETNQIQLTSDVPTTQIVLEYISDGLNPDGTASVPIEAVECLIAFINWKRKEYKKNTPLGEIQLARQYYVNEFDKLKHFNMMFSVQDFLDMMRTSIHGAPKR